MWPGPMSRSRPRTRSSSSCPRQSGAVELAELSGICAPRAAQSLAGAVVGHTVMTLTGIKTAAICPWAIREGVLLSYIEDGGAWWSEIAERGEEAVPVGGAPLRIATPPQ